MGVTLHDGDTIAVLPERRGRAEEIDHTFWFAVFNGVGTHGTGNRAKVGCRGLVIGHGLTCPPEPCKSHVVLHEEAGAAGDQAPGNHGPHVRIILLTQCRFH